MILNSENFNVSQIIFTKNWVPPLLLAHLVDMTGTGLALFQHFELGSIVFDACTGKDYILSYDPVTKQRLWVPFSDQDDIDDTTVFILTSSPSSDRHDFDAFLEIILEDLELGRQDVDAEMMQIILEMYNEYRLTNKMYYGPKSI